jgi:hypothetical protein|tara:strand:- start:131 stop:604 length:474 start_codon:yes stop_codon:yes gene_type:complete
VKLKVKSNFSFKKLAEYVSAGAFSTKAGQVFGSHIAKSSRELIESGKVKPGLKASTIQIRRARGTGGSKPLFETGRLAKSLKATKDGQLSMEHYGKYHLEGFKPKQIPFKVVAGEREWFMPNKGIKVEARNFISYGMDKINEPFKKIIVDIRKAFRK